MDGPHHHVWSSHDGPRITQVLRAHRVSRGSLEIGCRHFGFRRYLQQMSAMTGALIHAAMHRPGRSKKTLRPSIHCATPCPSEACEHASSREGIGEDSHHVRFAVNALSQITVPPNAFHPVALIGSGAGADRSAGCRPDGLLSWFGGVRLRLAEPMLLGPGFHNRSISSAWILSIAPLVSCWARCSDARDHLAGGKLVRRRGRRPCRSRTLILSERPLHERCRSACPDRSSKTAFLTILVYLIRAAVRFHRRCGFNRLSWSPRIAVWVRNISRLRRCGFRSPAAYQGERKRTRQSCSPPACDRGVSYRSVVNTRDSPVRVCFHVAHAQAGSPARCPIDRAGRKTSCRWCERALFTSVMAGLGPAIHVFITEIAVTRAARTQAGMTNLPHNLNGVPVHPVGFASGRVVDRQTLQRGLAAPACVRRAGSAIDGHHLIRREPRAETSSPRASNALARPFVGDAETGWRSTRHGVFAIGPV